MVVVVALLGVTEAREASACERSIQTNGAELRDLSSEPTRLEAELRKLLSRDPGNLGAHFLRIQQVQDGRPWSSEHVQSLVWLIDACPTLDLLGDEHVIAIRHRKIDKAWFRAERLHDSLDVHANAWRYRAIAEPVTQYIKGPSTSLAEHKVLERFRRLQRLYQTHDLRHRTLIRSARDAGSPRALLGRGNRPPGKDC